MTEGQIRWLRLRDHLAEFHTRRARADPGRWTWTYRRLQALHRRYHPKRRKGPHWHPRRVWHPPA